MKELDGLYAKIEHDLKAIKGQVYTQTMSIVTMTETAEGYLEKGDTQALKNYLSHIRDAAMFLKGFSR